jgi:hypothetical protein
MRSAYQPPRDKKYFHTKPKIDKRDMAILKKKIHRIEWKRTLKRYEEKILKD